MKMGNHLKPQIPVFTRTSFADFVVSAQSNDCTDKNRKITTEAQKTRRIGKTRGWEMLFLNLPITIFEYLSAGKAIVAPKIGQIVEVLQDQHTALLVTPRCIAELANAIIRLAHDEQLRNYLAKNAKIEAQKYSWNNYVDQLENIYLNPAIAGK
jgi:hypothetical protein